MRQPYRNHSNEKEKKLNKNVFNFQLEDRLIFIFISKQDLFTISVVLVFIYYYTYILWGNNQLA